MPNLILASSSPRRKELLTKLQIPYKIITSNVNEHFTEGSYPEEVVEELAIRKAKAVSNQYHGSVVLGADTVVALNNEILGKPQNREHARMMLQQLSGKTHSVFTGVAIVFQEKLHSFYEKTDVTFWELSTAEIEDYLDTGEAFDKAGSYGIQGVGALFVKSITGDYFTVVGLPISRLKRVFNEMELFL